MPDAAGADPEDRAAAADVVQSRQLPGEGNGVAEVRGGHPGAERNVGGHGRRRDEGGDGGAPRRPGEWVPGQVVVGPQVVEPELLRVPPHRGLLGPTTLREDDQADAHAPHATPARRRVALMTARRSAPPRSLTDELRSRSDEDLAALLRDRPDLDVCRCRPTCRPWACARTSRLSVQRALDSLDAPALQVAEVLAALPEPVAPAQVSRVWGAERRSRPRSAARARAGLGRAASRPAGPSRPGRPRPVARGSRPSARGRARPPLPAAPRRLLEDLDLPLGRPRDGPPRSPSTGPHVVSELLAGAPEGVRGLLDRLTWGPPVGQVADADRPVRRGGAVGPVDWLLAHGLLGVADAGHVVLPREVALALRGGHVHRHALVRPPAVPAEPKPATRVTSTAASAAAEAVRLVAALADAWGAAPPPVLRAGGLGVRDLRRVAAQLEVDEVVAARVAEVAYAAGLVADDGEADPRWAPTPAFDAWQDLPTGDRWVVLAECWLGTTRCPALVGTRDERDTPRAALGPDVDRAAAPEVRRWVLDRLAEPAGPGGPHRTTHGPAGAAR